MNKRKLTVIKNRLRRFANRSKTVAVVGRIMSWLHSEESRYPISCTVLSVEDSMEGLNGIEYSWLYTSKGLRTGAGVALDLSKLRAKGVDNGRGMVSSGPASFMKIYSSLNEQLRRGGVYKNGAVVCYLDVAHPDLLEFLALNSSDIPWAKRALYVDDNPNSPDYFMNNPHIDAILSAVRSGIVWLAKKRWYDPVSKTVVNYPTNPNDVWENRLFSQVCLEILLRSNATCLLAHLNAGQATIDSLEKDMVDGMTFLCELHAVTGAGRDNYYLSPSVDKQVGFGVLGLANMLARYGVTYKQFADCLYDYFTEYSGEAYKDTVELQLVNAFYRAFHSAGKVADSYGMERAFTVAPTASVSFKNVDLEGYTTAPEISPPICHPETKTTSRDSGEFGVVDYTYPHNVETAEQVGWDTYYKLLKGWQLLMDSTGKGHSISANIWSACPVDEEWLQDWLDSPLVTTYYRMLPDQSFTDKTSVGTNSLLDLASEGDFFLPVDTDDQPTNTGGFTFSFTRIVGSADDEVEGFCVVGKEGECSSCAE